MLAMVSTMNACTRMDVVPEYTKYGNMASTTTTTSAAAPVQATFRWDRVTRNPAAGRADVSVVRLMSGPSGK